MKSGIVKGNLYVIISVIISVMFLLSLKVKFNEGLVVSEQKQKKPIEVKVQNQRQHYSEKAAMQSQVTVVLPPPPPMIMDGDGMKTFLDKPLQVTKPKSPRSYVKKRQVKQAMGRGLMPSTSRNKNQLEPIKKVSTLKRQYNPIKVNADANSKKYKEAALPANHQGIKVNGRAYLRLLENGKGPEIEIAWPESATNRRRLFEIFSRCYGMKTALMDDRGYLFLSEGPSGRHWPVDLDEYSGYVRSASGILAEIEEVKAQEIRSHHSKLFSGSIVRVFPRELDAVLLGQLANLTAKKYKDISQVRAAYQLMGSSVIINSILVNGKEVQGSILLPVKVRGCRA